MDCKFVTPSAITRRIAKPGLTAMLFVTGILAPALMHASGLNGTLSLSSTGTDTIAVNGTDIDFDYSGGVNGTLPPTATGCPGVTCAVDGNGDNGFFTITSASTDSFALPILLGSNVTVADLNSTQQPTGTMSGPGLPLNGFITFTAEPTWSIALTEVLPGAETGTTGNCTTSVNCTPPGSPFNLTNEGSGQVSVSFAFIGTATDGTNTSNVGGTFSTTFSGTSYQQILLDLNNGEAIVSSADATINVSSLPEPASYSMLLLGGGLLGVSAYYRRRRQRQAQ